MTIPTEVIMKMATLGLNEDQAKAVADMLTVVEGATAATFEKAIEASRQKARDRWHTWDEKRRSNVSKRLLTTANASQQLARAEDRTSTTVTEPQEQKDRATASPTPRQHLEVVLDAERTEAVIEHRKRIKFPLTAHGAKLLAKDFAKCSDPNAAADEMVKRGWRGFDPAWMPGQPRAGPSGKVTVLDLGKRLLGEMEAAGAGTNSEIGGNQQAPRRLSSG